MSDYNIAPYSEDAMPQAISPEGAEIANTYLACGCSLNQTSQTLGREPTEISAMLQSPVIKNYIDGVLKESSYAHMEKIAAMLDNIIEMKWAELEEAEIGSNKDIAELLKLAHTMSLDRSKLLQADKPGPATQKNTQVNVYGEGSYGKLMDKLLNG